MYVFQWLKFVNHLLPRLGSFISLFCAVFTICIILPLSSPVCAGNFPDLLRSTLSHHPTLKSQQFLVGSNQSLVDSAFWQFFPTPSLSIERASASSEDPSFRGDDQIATMRLQQSLWTGGRLTGNLDRARAGEVSSKADMETTRQQLAIRLLQSWGEALASHLKAQAFLQSQDAHQRLLNQVQHRTEEGVSAQADVELARSRLKSVQADLVSALAQRNAALTHLCLLTGQTVGPEFLPDAEAALRGVDTGVDLNLLVARAKLNSPLVRRAQAQMQIALADTAIAKSALSPEVYLRAERQFGRYDLPDQPPQNRLYVGLSTNFGSGLSTLSRVESAQERYRAAIEDVQAQYLAIEEQIQNDFVLSTAAASRRSGLILSRQSAADVSASYERQFLAGRKQWQDIMNAARDLAQTDSQIADAIGTQVITGWRLMTLSYGVDAVLERAQKKP